MYMTANGAKMLDIRELVQHLKIQVKSLRFGCCHRLDTHKQPTFALLLATQGNEKGAVTIL